MSMTLPRMTHAVALLADISSNDLILLIFNDLMMASTDHSCFCKTSKLTCLVIQLYYFAGNRMQFHYYI